MRETRQSGSEGGGAEIPLSLPYPADPAGMLEHPRQVRSEGGPSERERVGYAMVLAQHTIPRSGLGICQ
jgi:hypothetical protein